MTDENVLSGEMPAEAAAPLPETTEPVDSAPTPNTEPDQQSPDPDDAGGEKPRGGFQRRIDELTRNWREEQRRVDALTQALLQQRGQPPQPEAPKPSQPAKLPTLEEFGYDEAKYQAALIEHATKQAESIVERRLAEADRQRAEQTRVESFATRQAEFAKSNPDFEDKVLRDPTLPITEGMRDVIIDSPSGPELAYWLATNRAEAEKIARLPPHLAALEMGRIEGRIEAQKAIKATAPAKPAVTKAPPPPPTVETADVPMEKSQEDMSADEWMRWREKQLTRKRKT